MVAYKAVGALQDYWDDLGQLEDDLALAMLREAAGPSKLLKVLPSAVSDLGSRCQQMTQQLSDQGGRLLTKLCMDCMRMAERMRSCLILSSAVMQVLAHNQECHS